MSRFSYIAMRGGGERVTGEVQSDSRREAISKLIDLGCHPIVVELESERRTDAKQWVQSIFGRVRAIDLAVFTRQLSSLLKAGLPMIQALSTLRQQCDRRHLKKVLGELEQSLSRDASTITEAMARHPKVFGPVYQGLVHSGEEGGRLVEVLDQLASHLNRSVKLRGQVVGAFIYPAFLLLLGLAAVFVLMAFVIPKFQKLFDSFGQDLPLPTRMLITVSGFMSDWWWLLLLCILACVVAAVFALKRPLIRLWVDKVLLALPVLGPMFLKIEVARIARTLGALLDGGVRIVEALKITAETVQNRSIRATFTSIEKSVSTGDPLGQAMEEVRIYPPLAVNLVRTGEQTGDLSEMLSELAGIYDDEAERAVNGAVKLLEPMLILIMGAVIAVIVAAVMLPILQSSDIVV